MTVESGVSKCVSAQWDRLKSVRWKNDPPKDNQAYKPTYPEHVANILTHGVYLLPVMYRCYNDLIAHRHHPNSDKAWACVVYGLVSIGLFAVSTLFHLTCCLNRLSQTVLRDVFHRCDRAMIYIFIAGNYTPWLMLKHYHPENGWGTYFRWAIWPLTSMGILYQQLFHEKFKLIETVFYVIIGLLPSIVVFEMVDDIGLFELKTGGIIYLCGVVFFKMDGRIPFAHAIWHLHVVAASRVHYDAVVQYLIHQDQLTVKPPSTSTLSFAN